MRQKTNYAQSPPVFEIAQISPHNAQITFAENAIEVENGWDADVYTLVVPWQTNLYNLVETHYDDWLAHAKDRDSEAEAAKVRAERNARLAATDYIMRADYPAPAERKQQIADYCQALRDIPEQPGFPWAVNWPEV